ncbi:MAG: sigma-70 family RNA polymerase sigma factor [Actinomycetota bacterium]|nr:sigma-70 family RNA polymerase sigma factor [Actinomycetota bacterium]
MSQLQSTLDVGECLQSLRPALLRVPPRGAREEPEDLVQEAFVRALHHEVEPERLPGWLRRVVTNLAHDAWRRDRSATTALTRLAKSEIAEPDHAEEVAENDLARTAADFVQDLPRLQREVVSDVAEGRSIAEVAQEKGLSLRAAEGHLRRARAALRKRMSA